MTVNDQSTNRLLQRLPREEWDAVKPHLTQWNLRTKQMVYERNQPLEFALFPESGIQSLVASVDDNKMVEIATIGKEGFIGVPLLLGADKTPGLCFCQVPGPSLKMPADEFKRLIRELTEFPRLMNRYAQSLFNQISQNVACNRSHNLEERCARWLLLCHDRMDERSFPLTQEFLGEMLGVRRPAVSLAASTLQSAGLITYVRGIVSVLDREGLENASCVCYRLFSDIFNELLGNESLDSLKN